MHLHTQAYTGNINEMERGKRAAVPIYVWWFTKFARSNRHIQFSPLDINNAGQLFANKLICEHSCDISYKFAKKEEEKKQRKKNKDRLNAK